MSDVAYAPADDVAIREAKLTAYALGELAPGDRAAVEAWLAKDPDAARLVADIRATVTQLEAELAEEPPVVLTAAQRLQITTPPAHLAPRRLASRPLAPRPIPAWATWTLFSAAAAALIAIVAWPRDRMPSPSGPTAPIAENAAMHPPRLGPPPDADAPKARTIQPPVAAEAAPPASPRLAAAPAEAFIGRHIASYFERTPGHRLYVQVDRPLYRPGDTIWIKSWEVATRDLSGADLAPEVRYELIDPRGASVLQKRVQAPNGRGTNDFIIPDGAPGGEYTVRAQGLGGTLGERKVIVASYQAPRIKKKLEFLRKAYGAGDEVVGTLELSRPTGEPLANEVVSAVVRLDGEELPRVQATTNADGGAVLRFRLPASIAAGDGLLTVLVQDGGATESISKRVPILMKKLDLAFFPEGGDLVAGLASRVYFQAKNTLGKPADLRGKIVDDHGVLVASIASVKNGLGRFTFVPATGRQYFAEVEEPVGISERYALPAAREAGCVLRGFDDLDSQDAAVKVAVRCTAPQDVVVAATLREQLFDAATVAAGPSADTIVYLDAAREPALAPARAALARAQGALRVTLFDATHAPLAERLVYRNRRNQLAVSVVADRERYHPQDDVALTIETRDAQGKPISAEVAVAVVDDTVVSYADDKSGHILSKVLLEPELVGEVDEPNTYLDLTEKDSGQALDLLMGTQGYRRFAWEPVFADPAPVTATTESTTKHKAVIQLAEIAIEGQPQEPDANLDPHRPLGAAVGHADQPLADDVAGVADPKAAAGPAKVDVEPPAPDVARLAVAAPKIPVVPAVERPAPKEANEFGAKDLVAPNQQAIADGAGPAARAAHAGGRVAGNVRDRDDFGDEIGGQAEGFGRRAMPVDFAPVRVFPAPPAPRVTEATTAGPRSDFRDTLLWAPAVKTDAAGKAVVHLKLSDAVTSFRAIAEGIGGGDLGRTETVLASSLPFSMTVKVPAAVTARDAVRLPLTLSNETDQPVQVSVHASFDALLSLANPADAERTVALAAKSQTTIFYAANPASQAGTAHIAFFAETLGLKDSFRADVVVEPAGFPQTLALSGTVKDTATHAVDITDPMPGSIEATLTLYPSPVATMLGGLKGMLQEPGGCFEQASSANYPNVAVLDYLQTHHVDDAALMAESRRLLDHGYTLLTGYETPATGYEWFGAAPAHEALTAYGLVEFHDMKAVYGGVSDDMIARTAKWLLTRRDGQGGYQVNPRALDSFGRASPEVTNAYITYSLVASGAASAEQLGPELARQAALAQTSSDAYVLALAANTLALVPSQKDAAARAAARLAQLQDPSGAWTKADHSITRSTGENLAIETTALALMALVATVDHPGEVDRAATWLNGARSGFGSYGTTQATVLALKALTQYADARRVARAAGKVVLVIDGADAGELAFEAGARGPLVLDGLGAKLAAGHHTIALRQTNGEALPYTVSVRYRTLRPANGANVAVGLTTALDKAEVKMGEVVRLTATVTNTTTEGQPMALARIGIPGGLTFQTWQLKELRDQGLIAFYETGPREVVLYFRDLAPSAVRQIPLDLVATVPGSYQASASQGYLYYTNDLKTWAEGVRVAVRE